MNKLEVTSSDSPEAQKMFQITRATLQLLQLVCEKEGLAPAHGLTCLGIAVTSMLAARHKFETDHGASPEEAQVSVHNALAANIRITIGGLASAGIPVQLTAHDLIPIKSGSIN